MNQVSKKTERRVEGIVKPLILVCLVAAASCAALDGLRDSPDPFLQYSVTVKDRHLNVIRVTLECFAMSARSVSLAAPSPVSGESFEPIGLRACDAHGAELDVGVDRDGLLITNDGRDFTVEYDLVLTIENRYSPNVRAMLTSLEADRSRLLGSDVFIVPEMQVSNGIVIDFELHEDSTLESAYPSTGSRVVVPTLDDLGSTIVVTGDYRIFKRQAGNTGMVFAISGEWSFGDEELFDVIERIVVCEIALFGSSPHDRYLFVCDRNPARGGEKFDHYGVHIGGSVILLLDSRLDRSQLFDTPMSIIAHEFFHNWNGEALWPRGSDFLWFTEGATVYYSYKVLLDLDIITERQFECKRREIISRYLENSYLESVPVGSAGNSDLSDKDMVNLLYDGGFLAAESIDEQLRSLTGGRFELIDVLRYMYDNGTKMRGVDDEMLLKAIYDVSGCDLTSFLRMLIHEPAPPLLRSLEQSS
jgi:predicted metalloprotease with PDZ domain